MIHNETCLPAVPPHMNYPVWELGEKGGPQAVADYLTWILDDPARTESAEHYIGFLKIGMHFLTAGQRFDEDGNVVDKIELNFWSDDYPPEEKQVEGGHAHSRAPRLWLFADPESYQEITIAKLLPPRTPKVQGVKVVERQLALLNKLDDGEGLGTQYHPCVIGERLVEEYKAQLRPLSTQEFGSTVVHQVGFRRGKAPKQNVAVSVQRQGPVENPYLSSFDGLRSYKGLTEEESEKACGHIEAVCESIKQTTVKFVGSTVLLRGDEFEVEKMEPRAIKPPSGRFHELAEGALRSLFSLGADINSH